MSSTPPPHSPSLSVEPDEAQSSPPPVQPESKTPGRECGAPRSIPDTTPLSHGSSMCQSHEGDTDWVEEFDWEDYGNCIREDLRSRVFVDFEVFMKHVLHVPDNWRTSWGPAIEAVKADSDFKRHHEEYCNHCDKIGSQEKTFYGPLMNAANAVLEAVSRSAFDGISSRVPNLVVLPKDRQPSEGLRSENPLRILKFNPYNNSLCDGTRIPRLIVDGEHATISLCLDVTDMGNRGRSNLEPRSRSQTSTTCSEEVYPHCYIDNCFRVDFWVVQVQKAPRR